MFIDFADLKRRITIEQAVDMLGLEMKQEGQALRSACPSCKAGGDRALVVTPSKGAFYCHAMQRGGDVIAFTSHCRSEDVKEAAAFLLGKTTSTVHSKSTSTSQQEPRQTVPQSSQGNDVGNRTPQPSPASTDALEKVAARLVFEHPEVQALGLSPEVTERLGVGFCIRGVLGKRVLFPLFKEGELAGFMGFSADLEPVVKFPANLVETPSNVVKLHKAG